MAEFQVLRKLMNPWALHLQKLGLELKCPLCLNLLNKPMLLPCNHLFCNICVPGDAPCGSECAVCKNQYDSRDMRPAPYIENIVAVYKTLDATFASIINQPLPSEESPVSALKTAIQGLKRDLNASFNGGNIGGGKGSTIEQRACLNSGDKSDIGANSKLNEVAACIGRETEEMYMNQAPVLSPESSPSFYQTRCITTNMVNQGSRNMTVKSTAKRSVDCLLDEGKDGITPISSKRQHISDNSSPYPSVFPKGHTEEKVLCAANKFLSQCPSEPAHEDHLPIAQSAKALESSNLSGRVCSFCHSSKISEGSGTMDYYANGKEVDGDSTMFPNVLPVHSKCIDWTPQIYFEGDTIKNLESELKRAAKLKCSSCGLKGAGLGCYHKSCSNTYHVPCAFDIEECRWDCVNFLMLCPLHNSVKFPGEKSRSKKIANGLKMHPLKTVNLPVNSTESAFWKSSPNGRQEWVLCGSALSPEEKYLLAKFADMCGATCPKFWKTTVTHVVAATDEKGACTRTFKVLMGVLNGKWILNMGWIKACMKANHYVNEEPYEIVSDTHGCIDGPKTGRLRFLNNEPKLFDGVTFYFNGDFFPAYKIDLVDLVRTAGGIVIESLDQLKKSPDTKMIVVYNCESSPCPNGENSVVLKRLTEAESVAKLIMNSPVVRHTWILECISASKRFLYTC